MISLLTFSLSHSIDSSVLAMRYMWGVAELGGALVDAIVSISPALRLLAVASKCSDVLCRCTDRFAVSWIAL